MGHFANQETPNGHRCGEVSSALQKYDEQCDHRA